MPRPTTSWLGRPPIVFAAEGDRPAAGAFDARDRAQRRGLARAVRADDADELALPDFEIDLPHRFDAAVGDLQVLDLEQRFGHSAAPRSAVARPARELCCAPDPK